MSKVEVPIQERIETGTFAFKAKSNNGYRLDMTGKVFGTKHGSVIVAALDSQFADDADLLFAAPDLLDALKVASMSAGFHYMMVETRELISAAIAKAEGRA